MDSGKFLEHLTAAIRLWVRRCFELFSPRRRAAVGLIFELARQK